MSFDREEFFKTAEVGGKKVNIAMKTMTKEQARKAYPYRPHNKYSESRFGGNTLCDDGCLLINLDAVRCKMCGAPTKKRYLIGGVCPDCDGRSECNGKDPHKEL